MIGREYRKPRSDRDREGNAAEIEAGEILKRHGYAVQPTGCYGSMKGSASFHLPHDDGFHLSPDLIAFGHDRNLVLEVKIRKTYKARDLFKPAGLVLYIDKQIVGGMEEFAQNFGCDDALYALKLPDGRFVSASYKDINPYTAHGSKDATATSKAAYTFDVDLFSAFEEMI
jgi:Holliday junction resolvase